MQQSKVNIYYYLNTKLLSSSYNQGSRKNQVMISIAKTLYSSNYPNYMTWNLSLGSGSDYSPFSFGI